MKKTLSLITIGLLGISVIAMFVGWSAKAQEIVWNTDPTPLPTPIADHMSVVHNGRIYVIGGHDGVNKFETVYFGEIRPNGETDAWISTMSLPEYRFGATAVVWNSFVYVIGGGGPIWGGRSEQNTVFYAHIRSDGWIETWNNGPNLPERLVNHASVVWNGRIYVLGGWNGYSSQNKVYYSDINPSTGSLGSWIQNDINLPFRWESTTALVRDGTILMIAGKTGPKELHDKVYSGSIETDGSIEIWDDSPPDLPEARAMPRGTLIDDNIYVVAGWSGGTTVIAEKTVYTAKFSVGDWTEVQNIPEPRYSHSAVALNGRIYVIGGKDAEHAAKDTIYYSSPPTLSAAIDIDPDTLNLKSNGQWITAYIELPEEYSVSEIDVSSILLNGSMSVDPEAPTEVGDHDVDNIPDLTVKFERASVVEWLGAADYGEDTGKSAEVALAITGEVAGTPFEGVDTIRVLLKG